LRGEGRSAGCGRWVPRFRKETIRRWLPSPLREGEMRAAIGANLCLPMLLAGALTVLSGCGGEGEVPAVQLLDSAGVRIVENHRPAWEEGRGWTIGAEPLLRLGVVEGDPALQFEGVTGLARLDDGTVIVADGGAQEVRFFDSMGSPLTVIGGKGEGPGEFSGLSGLGMG